MNGWLVTWLPAGHERIDRVVTILPEDYSADDVAKVLRSLFFVGGLTLAETLIHLRGNQVTPRVQRTTNDLGYTRLLIEFGSDAMEARLAKQIVVTADAKRRETIRWAEQTYDGKWVDQSFTRTHVGTVTFDSE